MEKKRYGRKVTIEHIFHIQMIYIITFFFSILSFYIAEKCLLIRKKIAYCFFLLIAILIPSILAGCRNLEIGVDVLVYVKDLYDLAHSCTSFALFQQSLVDPVEHLYLLFTYIVASYTNNVAWLLFFIQFLIISLVYISAFKFKQHIPIWFCMLIYFFLFYGTSLNATRQTMAQAFCLLSFSFLLNRKFLKSFLVFLPALGFHVTALIYLLQYPLFFFTISSYSISKKRMIEIALIFIASIIVIYLDTIINLLVSYRILGDKFIKYTTDDRWGSSFPIALFTYSLVFLMLFLCSPKQERTEIAYYYYFRYILLSCVIFSFSGYISTLAVRGVYYFSFLFILILPMLLFDCRKIRKPFKKMFPLILCFFLFYWFMTIMVANLSGTYPYTSKILGIN
jgi:hypothetical protein